MWHILASFRFFFCFGSLDWASRALGYSFFFGKYFLGKLLARLFFFGAWAFGGGDFGHLERLFGF